MIGQKFRRTVFHADFICVLNAAPAGRIKACADFHAFGRIDRHQAHGEVAIELAVNGRAPASRDACGFDMDDGADGVAVFAHSVEKGFPVYGGFGIWAPKGIF